MSSDSDLSSPEFTDASIDDRPLPPPITPRKPRKKQARASRSPTKSPSKKNQRDEQTGKNDSGKQSLVFSTSSDNYFTLHSRPSRTSNAVYTDINPPLTAEEYHTANPSAHSRVIGPPSYLHDPLLFARFARELDEGFNLLCYGFGSKRQILNRFAREVCAKKGHVIVSNAYRPDFTLKALLNSIEENIPGVTEYAASAAAEHASGSTSNASSAIDHQVKRIYSYFYSISDGALPSATTKPASPVKRGRSKSPTKKSTQPQHKPPLYLIIHNIDALALRTPKAKSVLSLLALNPFIHIIASIDHLNAPLLFSSEESFARKHPHRSSTDKEDWTGEPHATRGFAWLWHDLTTLQGYDIETSYADRSALSGLSSGRKNKDGALLPTAGVPGAMTETAALHVIASVTQRAKQLFVLMAKKQLEAIEFEAAPPGNSSPQKDRDKGKAKASAPTGGGGTNDMQRFAIGYDMLYNLANESFIAHSDSALRAILGEFRDHNLVMSAQAGGMAGEVLWIPLRKERLLSVLKTMDESSSGI